MYAILTTAAGVDEYVLNSVEEYLVCLKSEVQQLRKIHHVLVG